MTMRSTSESAKLGVSRGSRSAARLVRGLSAGSMGLVALMAARATSAADITVDAGNSPRGNPPFWSEMVGCGTARLTLRADLQTHFKIVHRELGMKRVRGHGILNDDMNIYQGPGSYNWTSFDTVLQAIDKAGMRPGMELSFMPKALAASGNDKDPPGDYGVYTDFIQAVVERAVELFGAADVEQWYWEVWNEPNYSGFWTPQDAMGEYYNLYRAAVAGATAALPNIKIGGPVTTQGSASIMAQFLQEMKSDNTRVSFLASHAYPGGSGPNASATFGRDDNDGRVDVITGAGYSLEDMPSLNTEWNTAYTGQGGNIADNTVSMDTHANAPFILKSVKLLADQVQGDTPPLAVFSYWVASDIFDESGGPIGSYIDSQGGNLPFGQVFGLMTFQGVRKAAFNAFRMLNYLGPDQLAVTGGTGDRDGVDGMATISENSDEVAVIVYNYYSAIATTGSESVTLTVNNLPFAGEEIFVTHFQIDPDHSNPYRVWADQGSPNNPSDALWEEMRAEQHLALFEPVTTITAESSYSKTFDLPNQGAALIILSRERPLTGRDALVDMEGEDYDGYSGVTKEDSGDDTTMGQSIAASSGNHIYYNDVDFRDGGVDSVNLRVKADSATTLELHADSETGTLLGTCDIPATGGWADQSCDLTPTTGVHDLYVVFGGSVHLNSLRFDPTSGTGGTGGAGGTGGVGAGGAGGGGAIPPTGGAVPTGGVPTDGGTLPSGGVGATSGTGGANVPTGGLAPTGGASTGAGPAVTGGVGATGTTGGTSSQTCQPPTQLCGAVCVNTQSDPAHCGVCGTACQGTQVCSAGVCSDVCAEGLTQCGQGCCAAGESCEQGQCVAPPAKKQSADEGGCGCRVGSPEDSPSRGLLASLLALGLFAGRRRRRRA